MDVSVLNNIVKIYKGTEDGFDQPFFKCHSILDLSFYEFTTSSTSLPLQFRLVMKGKEEVPNGVGGLFEMVEILYECDFVDLTIGGASPYDFDEAHSWLSAIFNPVGGSIPTLSQVLESGNNAGGYSIDMYGGEITSASLVDASMYKVDGTPGVSAVAASTITSENGIIVAAT